MLKNSLLITAFLTLLFSATSAQRVNDGPFVGDDEAKYITRAAEWYCDITRIVGCVKYNHVCFVELVFGDDRCDPVRG